MYLLQDGEQEEQAGGYIGGGARSNAGIFTNGAGTQTNGFTFGIGGNASGNGAGRRRLLWRAFR